MVEKFDDDQSNQTGQWGKRVGNNVEYLVGNDNVQLGRSEIHVHQSICCVDHYLFSLQIS